MKCAIRYLLALAALLLAATALAQTKAVEERLGDASSYKLGSGDVITIVVLGEDDLKREHVRLTDAGTIQFPVLGELRVKGLTIGELEQLITKGLKGRYLVNPNVTVSIDQYRPFFVTGEVKTPGGYPYVPGLNVLKAVTLAGGFKDRANKNQMYVVRDGDSKQQRHKVDMNSSIMPGDVLTVEESFF